jgi:hypothetical protein
MIRVAAKNFIFISSRPSVIRAPVHHINLVRTRGLRCFLPTTSLRNAVEAGRHLVRENPART